MTWANLDDQRCPCSGSGWAEVDLGVWKECPIHYEGQLHPESRVLLLDEPNRLAEEERKSGIKFQIKQLRDQNYDLHLQIKNNQAKMAALELDLINRTPTVRAMPAIRLDPVVEVVDELDWGDIFEENR
jgi:hypothetical protein